MAFQLTILTLFPEMFPASLAHSLVGKALARGDWALDVMNIRDFATGSSIHKNVDDTPYGGGAGMVMRADVVAAAIRQARENNPNAPVIFLTPAGKPFQQTDASSYAANEGLIVLCGHYEGIDQRVLDTLVDAEVSLGDFILTGGESAALILAEAVIRLLPETLGNDVSTHEESFCLTDPDTGHSLLEYPHYTRPAQWEGQAVPPVLTSGNHAEIERWRLEQARTRTQKRRPDLLKK